jgi:type IV pilus secretin PilQ/predicted competence protein
MDFDVFLLEEPYRIVVDLVGIAAPSAVATPAQQAFVTDIRCSLWKADPERPIVRYVVETAGEPNYEAEVNGPELTLWIQAADSEAAYADPIPAGPFRAAFEVPAELFAPRAQFAPAPQAAALPAPAPGMEEEPPPVAADEPTWSSLMVPQEGLWDAIMAMPIEGAVGEDEYLAMADPFGFDPQNTLGWIDDETCAETWGEAVVLDLPGAEFIPEAPPKPEPLDTEMTAAQPAIEYEPAVDEQVAVEESEEPAAELLEAEPEELASEAQVAELREPWPAYQDEPIDKAVPETQPDTETVPEKPSEPAKESMMVPLTEAIEIPEPVAWTTLVPGRATYDETWFDEPTPSADDRLATADELLTAEVLPFWDEEEIPEAAEASGTQPEEGDSPESAAAKEKTVYDPFARLIERHREAAAERAARDWAANCPHHDQAPQISQSQGFTVSSSTLPPMSLDVQGAQVRTALRAIAEFAGVNIVADANVQGTVTMRVVDLPWRDMLDTVCRSLALVALDHGPVIRVATAKTAQEEAVASESAERRKEDFMPLETRVVPLHFANASELQDVAGTVRSARGKIEVDDRTNSLIVTDIAPRLTLIEEMVTDLDSQTMQVEITAEIVDIDATEARNLGVAWGLENVHSPSANVSGSGQIQAADVVDPVGTIQVGVLRSFGETQATIQALATANKADIISTPRITTVNNRQARILVGKEVPLITMDEAGNAITELKKVGITLEVTPYVNSETQITLDLHPEVSDLSSQSTVAGGVIFTTTEADTRVMVREGETAVIAGLIRTQNLEFTRGVPYLKDVPVLGHLFRSSDTREEKRELLVFVTPRIVRPDGR